MDRYVEVKILKAQKPKFWYAKRIGETFICMQLIDRDYVVIFGDKAPHSFGTSTIEESDCEVIEDTASPNKPTQ